MVTLVVGTATQFAYGYPTSVEQSVPAIWTDLYFSICISNAADVKYEKLFIRAVEEWKKAWPHFSYIITKDQSGCDIDVNIVKGSSGSTKERHSQGSTRVTYWTGDHIISADITLISQVRKDVKQGDYCCIGLLYETSEKRFFLTSLHEFGHALNLSHAKDDGKEPFDVMQMYGDAPEHVISSVTLKTLDGMYGTESKVKDHEIIFKPSVTVDFKLDKDSYAFDEIIKVSGKVSNTKGGGTGSVFLLRLLNGNPSMSLNKVTEFIPENDGTFSTDMVLHTNHSGKWVVLVQYMGVSKSMLLDVEEIPYAVSAYTDRASYFVGNVVKINGHVTRYGETVTVDLINPAGITFAHKMVPVSSDKKFSAELTLKESKFTLEGQWTVRLAYASAINDVTFNVQKL